MSKHGFQRALMYVQRHFPEVKEIVDSTQPVLIAVQKDDNTKGKKLQPAACAFARACLREEKADGCIIGIGISYLIKGKTAIRYQTSGTVGREITTFDRHGEFAPGENYRLSAIPPAGRLDNQEYRQKRGPHKTRKGKLTQRRHHTSGVRVLSDS